MPVNPHSAYKETNIKTSSPAQLVVLLYTEAVKQCDFAIELLSEGPKPKPANIEKVNKAICKAQDIVTELMASLDFEQGGEIAQNLFSLYTWFNRELIEANITKDPKRLKPIRAMLDELRGAWVTAAAQAPSAPGAQTGVNIAG